MSISEGLDLRHIDVIMPNKANGKKESNKLEIRLVISNKGMLLEKSKSKSDGNIDEESGPSNEIQFASRKRKSVDESIDCEVHQGDVVSMRNKKLTGKMRASQLDELEKKSSNLHRKMTRKTNKVEDMLYSFKNTGAVGEQLQQFVLPIVKDCVLHANIKSINKSDYFL